MTPTMYGVLKINGVRSYFRVILLVNVRTNIYIIQDSISSSFFLLNLGCFACFCPCCMNCKLAKHLGESSAIGCCPGSLSYLRTKLRTARRVQVRRDTFFKNAKRIFVELDWFLGFLLWWLLFSTLLWTMCSKSNGKWTWITRIMGCSSSNKKNLSSKWSLSTTK